MKDTYVSGSLEFSVEDGVYTLVKPALIFYSGEHKDRKSNKHNFPPERVQRLVANTNEKIRKGGLVSFQADHKKDIDSTLGRCGEVYSDIITPQNCPFIKDESLFGRLGIFTKDLVAKGADVVEKIKNNLISTLSAGIDGDEDVIMEVSATNFPALRSCQLFSSMGNEIEFSELTPVKQANEENPNNERFYSMESALGLEKAATKKEEEFSKFANALGKVLIAIHTASEEQLKGKNPVEESYSALEYFNREIETLFELTEEEYEEEEGTNSALLPTTVRKKESPHKETITPTRNFSKKTKKHINFSLL